MRFKINKIKHNIIISVTKNMDDYNSNESYNSGSGTFGNYISHNEKVKKKVILRNQQVENLTSTEV